MKILALNCGSSSLKYALISMPGEETIAGGEARGVGPPTERPARIVHRRGRDTLEIRAAMPDHASAFRSVTELLAGDGREAPEALGHRIVHGGARFRQPVRVDGRVREELDALRPLAPIHNPPAAALVGACAERYPGLPQVAVFDTAFHATIPVPARTYALPMELREELGIRKYGFHGISHDYVAGEAARVLGVPRAELDAVSCHLGSGGASLCALRGGRSADTTMGYSPLPGLVMSTRCGDLDPGAALRILAREREDGAAVERILQGRSGVLGMSGFSADIRDVFRDTGAGNGGRASSGATARHYLWRIRKYLGAYLAAAAPARAVIFTDTVGEEVPLVRWAVCAGMEAFGVRIDAARNADPGPLPADVAAAASAVRILVIHTDEERAIARAAYACLGGRPAGGGDR